MIGMVWLEERMTGGIYRGRKKGRDRWRKNERDRGMKGWWKDERTKGKREEGLGRCLFCFGRSSIHSGNKNTFMSYTLYSWHFRIFAVRKKYIWLLLLIYYNVLPQEKIVVTLTVNALFPLLTQAFSSRGRSSTKPTWLPLQGEIPCRKRLR